MCGAPIEGVSRPIGLQLHMSTRPPINSLLPKIMAGSRYSHASAVDLILMQRSRVTLVSCFTLCCQVVNSWSCACRPWQNPQAHSRSTLFEHERRQYLSSSHCGKPWFESSAALTHYLSSSLPNLSFLGSL